jgi:hypothetical protein
LRQSQLHTTSTAVRCEPPISSVWPAGSVSLTGSWIFAISQPEDADINENLFRPTAQEI